MADTYQTLTLVLTDGRRVTYMGRPQLTAGEAVRVVEILAGEPTPLPPGCTWGTLSADPRGDRVMTFLPNQYEHHDGCIDHATCEGMLRARDEAIYAMAQEIYAMAQENARLRSLVEDLQARVGAQAWLLAQKAERREM